MLAGQLLATKIIHMSQDSRSARRSALGGHLANPRGFLLMGGRVIHGYHGQFAKSSPFAAPVPASVTTHYSAR
jgi:hypothetical protein